MRAARLLAVAAIWMTLAANAPMPGTSSEAMPPARYRGPAVVTLQIVSTQAELDYICGKAPEGKRRIGCAKGSGLLEPRTVTLGEPCPHGAKGEVYGRWLCHELGHVKGWSGQHES